MTTFKKFLAALQKCEEILMVAAFIVMVCTMFGSVLARNVFKATITWFDELARICMVFMVLLGAEAGLRDGTQVSVTAVTDKLSGKVKKAVALLAKLVLLIFCVMMTVAAVNAISSSVSRGVTTTSLNWPMAVPYTALLIGFLAASLVQAGTFVKMLMDFNKPGEKKEEEAA